MDGYGKRILVVEDSETNRQLLALLLEQADYNVHLAADGLEALDEMNRRHFDAVVTDYDMPRMNGLELLALSRVVWPETPVVLVSGITADLAESAVDRGAFAWVRKPFEPEQLLRTLRSAIEQSPQDRWAQMSARMLG